MVFGDDVILALLFLVVFGVSVTLAFIARKIGMGIMVL
jgi:hypothetical protein